MNVLPELNPNCDGTQANGLLVVSDYQSNAVPGRGTIQRQRLVAALGSLGLEFDVYDTQGTNYTDTYNTIGRREDRQGQAPRPPHNGASTLQLAGYDCIWYQGGLLKSGVTLTRQSDFADRSGVIHRSTSRSWRSGSRAARPGTTGSSSSRGLAGPRTSTSIRSTGPTSS